MRKLTAQDVYEAVFNSYNPYAQLTRHYVSGFAANVLNINLTIAVIDEILAAREAWLACEATGFGSAYMYQILVEHKLSKIVIPDLDMYP